MVYLAPTTKEEYLAMLDWSIEQTEHPVAIRIPGNNMISDGKKVTKDYSKLNTYEVVAKGSEVAIVALGTFLELGKEVAKLVEEKIGVKATVINPVYITGIDKELLERLKENHKAVLTLEDGILDGGFGEKIARFYGNSNVNVINYGYEKKFLDRYDPNEILKLNKLTKEQIAEDIENLLN